MAFWNRKPDLPGYDPQTATEIMTRMDAHRAQLEAQRQLTAQQMRAMMNVYDPGHQHTITATGIATGTITQQQVPGMQITPGLFHPPGSVATPPHPANGYVSIHVPTHPAIGDIVSVVWNGREWMQLPLNKQMAEKERQVSFSLEEIQEAEKLVEEMNGVH